MIGYFANLADKNCPPYRVYQLTLPWIIHADGARVWQPVSASTCVMVQLCNEMGLLLSYQGKPLSVKIAVSFISIDFLILKEFVCTFPFLLLLSFVFLFFLSTLISSSFYWRCIIFSCKFVWDTYTSLIYFATISQNIVNFIFITQIFYFSFTISPKICQIALFHRFPA